ncbi:MAG TPA: epoxide hydrolase [Allosphingosinicella sp.]|nr:epoxide hydrolase [Allosphingosinicella sp.]
MKAERFQISIPDERIEDMRRRIRTAAWPGDFGNEGWHYGVEQVWLQNLVAYWANEHDWRGEEARMNALPHYRVDIDGNPIHFVHVRSGRKDAIPLLLIHGWPETFWDWQALVAELMREAPGPAFDLVVPSLPGVAFSSPLRKTGVNVREIARLWVRLMCDVLGYPRFAAAGGDWGSLIAAELGHAHPDRMLAIHLTMLVLQGIMPSDVPLSDYAPDERWMLERMSQAAPHLLSHITVHSIDPQTLAYAMADSPVGTAAWLWERRWAGSERTADLASRRNRDSLCTLASLYWLTNTIGSSMRIYREQFSGHGLRMNWPLLHGRQPQIPVATGVALGPKEVMFLPRAEVAKRADLRRWQVLPRGGHFLPAEEPELLAAEYRAFFGQLLGSGS